MAVNFTRSLGDQSGVQLNPLVDNSEIATLGAGDQNFAIAMRNLTGRVDRPFNVEATSFYRKMGYGEAMRVNALNEAWVQVYEALNNGAKSAIVQRLVADDHKNSWLSFNVSSLGIIDDNEQDQTRETSKNAIKVELEDFVTNNFEISLKHHECFNDGISISIHANEQRNEMSEIIATSSIRLRLHDSRGNQLFDFSGSIDPNAVDDFGSSLYLPDVVELATEDLEILISSKLTEIDPDSSIYGYNEYGQEKWVSSDVVIYFDEGSVGAYTTADYYEACVKLERTNFQYKYISSGGNKNVALIDQLAELAYRTNKQMRFDVMVGSGDAVFSVEQMIQTYRGMYGTFDATYAHLIHAYWTPLKCTDPTGVNGRILLGSATLNIALACKRNGIKNAQGFALKNYPIAGKLFPINRRGVTQVYIPSDTELSQLAQAKINPAVFDSIDGTGMYIFKDSLTSAQVINSLRKLIAVIEMSTSVDDAVTSTAKSYLQLPMDVAVKYTANWLQTYFEGVKTANWIVPSSDPQMNGASFKYEVLPNPESPYDQMIIKYWLRYDGTNRQTFVTQTLTK